MKALYAILLILVFQLVSYSQISDFKPINFIRADNQAKLHNGASLNNLPVLAYNLPTDVEKFRAIYTWVCTNIKGDNYLHSKVKRKRNKLKNDHNSFLAWNKEYKKNIFKKLLKHKKTMCTGYAYLIKELSYLANIECVIIDGYGRTVDSNVDTLELANHSWNAVKLNQKWYLCDATWSSGYMNGDDIFINQYNDGYFLTNPVLFGKNHYPLKKEWLLTDDTITTTDFTTAPLVYGEAFKYQILPLSPQEMKVVVNKNKELKFNFKTSSNITKNEIALVHYIGTEEKVFDIYDLKKENGLISFNSRFKYKGLYDIHLKVKNDIVATYTLNVHK